MVRNVGRHGERRSTDEQGGDEQDAGSQAGTPAGPDRIVRLGHWVLEEACRQAKAWDHETGSQLSMSVNVSARQIQAPGFVEDVAQILGASGLTPDRLTLELTESVLMQDVEQTATTLDALKALGVRLAIDDFGTGYSSLTYLDRFPIDELKIDRSFVATMTTGPDQSALVHSILKLGETLRLQTVAEGIEQADQLAELQALGAGLGQGYYFAEPLTPEALTAFLAGDRPMGAVGFERGAA